VDLLVGVQRFQTRNAQATHTTTHKLLPLLLMLLNQPASPPNPHKQTNKNKKHYAPHRVRRQLEPHTAP
jgi:hypothetical protein